MLSVGLGVCEVLQFPGFDQFVPSPAPVQAMVGMMTASGTGGLFVLPNALETTTPYMPESLGAGFGRVNVLKVAPTNALPFRVHWKLVVLALLAATVRVMDVPARTTCPAGGLRIVGGAFWALAASARPKQTSIGEVFTRYGISCFCCWGRDSVLVSI